MLLQILLVVAGIALLYYGGEVLVRSVANLAASFRVSPFVIAFTVVAFGTSAPELAASGAAAFDDSPEIALGNVVGSNIANIALILGLVALVAPLTLDRTLLRREVPFMLLTALAMLGFAATGHFTRPQALLLLVGLVIFLWALIRGSGVTTPEGVELPEQPHPWRGLLGSVLGLAFLIGGARILVDAAQTVARELGVPESVIGLTLVAFGTSVPELASCLVAGYRQHGSIVLGNIIGSNVFNTLLILPTAMLIRPFPIERGEWAIHLGVMLGFTLLLVLFFLGRRLGRVEGAVLFAGYLAYIGWIALSL